MGFRVALISVYALLCLSADPSTAQCGPQMEKQIAGDEDLTSTESLDELLKYILHVGGRYRGMVETLVE